MLSRAREIVAKLIERQLAGRLVRQLYLGLLGREPDPIGLGTFLNALRQGSMTIAQLAAALTGSDEFKARYSSNITKDPEGCLPPEVEAVCALFADRTASPRVGYVTDFTGVVTNVGVIAGLEALSGTVEGLPIPSNFHGEALEWLGVLRSVLAAGDRYVILELGAGWGPWCAISYRAARRRGVRQINVLAIEGDAGHVQFITDHFATNHIPDADATILHGAVGVSDGTAEFPRHKTSSADYGGAASFGESGAARSGLDYFVALRGDNVAEIERLASYSLDGLLRRFDMIDLVHCDIQGAELDVLSAAMSTLIGRARRVVVGTHSHQLDRDIAMLFAREGWRCEGLSSAVMRQQANVAVGVRDGCQVWANPALLPDAQMRQT